MGVDDHEERLVALEVNMAEACNLIAELASLSRDRRERESLLPDAGVIQRRLVENARERRVLLALRRLVQQVEQWSEEDEITDAGPGPRPSVNGRH